jgi:hypothetical protein
LGERLNGIQEVDGSIPFSSTNSSPPSSTRGIVLSVATLRVDFQDGFDDDEVVVSVDGSERVRRGGVTTKRVIGLACKDAIDVEQGPHSVRISVPGRGISKEIEVDVDDAAYVGVSVADGNIAVIVRGGAFGYG